MTPPLPANCQRVLTRSTTRSPVTAPSPRPTRSSELPRARAQSLITCTQRGGEGGLYIGEYGRAARGSWRTRRAPWTPRPRAREPTGSPRTLRAGRAARASGGSRASTPAARSAGSDTFLTICLVSRLPRVPANGQRPLTRSATRSPATAPSPPQTRSSVRPRTRAQSLRTCAQRGRPGGSSVGEM